MTPFLDAVGTILAFLVGVVVMSMSSVVIDRLLGIKISGSWSARMFHSILGMTKGAFLVWLMSVTIFGG